MKNSTGKWLLVTFLIGLSVLCFALYDQYFSGDKPTVPDNPAQAEPAEPAGPKPDEPATDDADKPKTVYNEFPRKPSVYENMAAQNVGGLGKEQLFEVYDSSDGYYLFFDSASDSYDVNSDGAKKSAVMAKVSSNLTLEYVSVIAKSESFLSVKITPDGFFVATSGDEFDRFYDVSFDGEVRSSVFSDKSKSVFTYLSDGEILCFLAQNDKLAVKVFSYSLDVLRTTSVTFLGAEKIFSVLPDKSSFNVVAASNDCFKVFDFNRTDGFVGEKLNVNARLCNFEPFVSDGKQCYFYQAETSDALLLCTLDGSFSVVKKNTLDKPEKAFSVPVENGFLVLTALGGETKWLLFCEHLDFVVRADVDMTCDELCFHTKGIGGETLCFSSGDKLVYGTFSGGKLNVTHSFEGASGGVSANGAYAFCGTAKNGFFQSSFGDSDVFVLRPSDMPQ